MQTLGYFLAHYFHYFVYCLIAMLFLLSHRTGLFKDAIDDAKKDRLFFAAVCAVALLASLHCHALETLDYYDEQNYLLSAGNIAADNTNALCYSADAGRCLEYHLMPHGLGLAAVYSLLYTPSFRLFYANAAVLNLLLYLINAFLVYLAAQRLFKDRFTARCSCILLLMLPYNIMYAATVMPATLCLTLALTAIYGSVCLAQRPQAGRSLRLLIAVSLMILSTVRVEYTILLGPALAALLIKTGTKTGTRPFDRILTALAVVNLPACLLYALGYLKQRMAAGGRLFGPGCLNASYFGSYLSSPSFVILSFFFLACLFYGRRAGGITLPRRPLLGLASLFFLLIAFYSFYNFPGVYRYTIPASCIYALLAAAGMAATAERLPLSRTVGRRLMAAVVLLISLSFIRQACYEKGRLINDPARICSARFLRMIDRATLSRLLPDDPSKAYFSFKAPYLGQISSLNHITDLYVIGKLKRGATVYYIDNPFGGFRDSPLRDNNALRHECVFRDDVCGFAVNRISLKRGP